jgi:hypothetical protein
MRALLLILIASSALGQGRFDRFNQRTDQGRSTRGFEQSSYASFEFAPASGAGMGAACACTTPTGAKGEALTFTRAGDATCSKQGLATTGIANGDLVACTANQPRVESSGGVLGLRVEGARTNETLRSQQIENAVWATTVAGVAAPTITADFAVAPDGTTTADRVQIPACPNAGYDASGVNQTSGAIASPSSSSVYLKANSGTPSVSVCMYGITTGTRTCTQFALNTSTWTRAVVPNVTNTGGMNMEIACENRTGSYSGATNTGAADILVWGAQSEAGAYATSYIPTVAASATRNAEAASLTMASSVGPSFCLAASGQWPSSSVGAVALAQLGTAAPDLASVGRNNNTAAAFTINATSITPAVSAIGTAVIRAVLSDASGTRAAWWNAGGVSAPAASMTATASAVSLGVSDGIVTRVQADPSPSRCSP